jgi:WS/DGAT/MGAT family acyltransferase
MIPINAIDASWLAIDSEDTPMHVGSLQIFSLPENCSETFLRDEVERMKAGEVVSPWNLKLTKSGILGRLVSPSWSEDKAIDINYHVRHSALPKPGGERELGILISRLHSNHMDFHRPLWECHFIEGLENNRFAIYTKIHHSLVDGVNGIRLIKRTLADSADELNMPGPWSIGPKARSGKHTHQTKPKLRGLIRQTIDTTYEQVSNTPQLIKALAKLVASSAYKHDDLMAPFDCPNSILNTRVTHARRFATQQYSLERLKNLASATDSSLNDIVLFLCSSALRAFLLERDNLPDQALTAGIPVNVRLPGDESIGTEVSFILANLASEEADVLKRLAIIKKSTKTAKQHLQTLPRKVLVQYTMLMMAPFTLQLLTGLAGRVGPAYNVTISNVPGPKDALYYCGCKLEAIYPLSMIVNGGALNITCLSYNGSLNFGYIACRETLPSMQHLAVYSGDALKELENVVNKKKKTKKSF